MGSGWISLRMRAADAQGRHRSGGERLVPAEHSVATVVLLVRRGWAALGSERGRIVVTVESVPPETIRRVPALPARTVAVSDAQAGREAAFRMLVDQCAVTPDAARAAIRWLLRGPSPAGGPMRGAMLVDRTSGDRLEPDPARGVRVSCVDLDPQARARFALWLPHGPPTRRFREAWTLAAKVAAAPGVVAELCWSDDPNYLPGYVASSKIGYVRFTAMKEPGQQHGGRAFFVDPDGLDRDRLIEYLERTPVLVTLDDPQLLQEV